MERIIVLFVSVIMCATIFAKEDVTCDTINGGFIEEGSLTIPPIENNFVDSCDVAIIKIHDSIELPDDYTLLEDFDLAEKGCIVLSTTAKKSDILGYCDHLNRYLIILDNPTVSTAPQDFYERLKSIFNEEIFGKNLMPESISDWLTPECDRKLLKKSRNITLANLNKLTPVSIIAFNPTTGYAIVKSNKKVFPFHLTMALTDYISKETNDECMTVAELKQNEKWSDIIHEKFIKEFIIRTSGK